MLAIRLRPDCPAYQHHTNAAPAEIGDLGGRG
jgi:hypothetical protein